MNLVAQLNEKIKNDFQGKKVSILFNSLPEMQLWTHRGLDHSTKFFFANIVHFLAKRSCGIQITNNKECLSHIIASEAWKKCKTKHAAFSKHELPELLQADAIIALGCHLETLKLLKDETPCFVIQTSQEEVFPEKAKVITESPDFAISEIIKELNTLWRVRE